MPSSRRFFLRRRGAVWHLTSESSDHPLRVFDCPESAVSFYRRTLHRDGGWLISLP